MKAWAESKDATCDHPLANPTAIEVYDDEIAGQVSLYYTDGKDRHPIRTVTYDPPAHFVSVLSALGLRNEFVDCRKDQTVPLPTTDEIAAMRQLIDREIANQR